MHTIPTWATYLLLSVHYVVLLLVAWAISRSQKAQLGGGRLWFLLLYIIIGSTLLSYVLVTAENPELVMLLMMFPAVIFVAFLSRMLFRDIKEKVEEEQHR